MALKFLEIIAQSYVTAVPPGACAGMESGPLHRYVSDCAWRAIVPQGGAQFAGAVPSSANNVTTRPKSHANTCLPQFGQQVAHPFVCTPESTSDHVHLATSQTEFRFFRSILKRASTFSGIYRNTTTENKETTKILTCPTSKTRKHNFRTLDI
jgi:hypothetical protein